MVQTMSNRESNKKRILVHHCAEETTRRNGRGGPETSIVGTDLITAAQYYAPCGSDAAVVSLRRLLSNYNAATLRYVMYSKCRQLQLLDSTIANL